METLKELDRKTFIGGSDIAAVMGVSRWKTPLKLWAEKTGKIQPSEAGEKAILGTKLEAFVADEFTARTGIKVRRSPVPHYTHREYLYMGCQVDRLVQGTDDLLECKTCGAWIAKEWDGEEIPTEYILQVNWQLGITGRDTGYIAVLIGGQDFRHKQIQFDETLFAKQVEYARVFWEEFVLKDQPPMAVAGDSQALLDLFPDAAGSMVEITDKKSADYMNAAIERRIEIKKEKDAIEKELDDIESKLKQVVGEAPGVVTNLYQVTWTPQVSRRADPEAMKDAGVFEKFSKESKTRVLRVKAQKGEKANGVS